MAFNCNQVSSNAVPEEEIERVLSRACTAEQDLSSLALEADHDAHEGHFTGGKFRWAMRSAAANDFYLRTSFREIVRASAGLPTEQRLIAYDACDEHEVKAPLGLFRKRLDARRNTKPKKPDAQLLVCTPFDPSAFNFTKIKDPREKILTPLLLNNAPYEILTNKFPLFAGHMLLVSKLPVAQQMTSAHLGAIAELLQSCSMSAYFNSWCASASVNHFHCHLIDEVPPVAALPLVRGPLVRGVRCLQPEGFPGFCYVFRIRDVWLLADLVRAMQEDNQVGAPSARHHCERPPLFPLASPLAHLPPPSSAAAQPRLRARPRVRLPEAARAAAAFVRALPGDGGRPRARRLVHRLPGRRLRGALGGGGRRALPPQHGAAPVAPPPPRVAAARRHGGADRRHRRRLRQFRRRDGDLRRRALGAVAADEGVPVDGHAAVGDARLPRVLLTRGGGRGRGHPTDLTDCDEPCSDFDVLCD